MEESTKHGILVHLAAIARISGISEEKMAEELLNEEENAKYMNKTAEIALGKIEEIKKKKASGVKIVVIGS